MKPIPISKKEVARIFNKSASTITRWSKEITDFPKPFLLGPNSPISYADNAEQGLSRILHDINFHLGEKFAHNINGGVDYYAVQGYFGQYFSLETTFLT